MKRKVYLGFDFGTYNIGVAVGQMVTATASPLPILRARNGVPRWQEVAKLLQHWRPQALVVGAPFKTDDAQFTEITQRAQEFAALLREKFKLPVYVVDERLTTKAAREFLFDNFGGYKALQASPIDSFAAKIILESWMHQQMAGTVVDG
jgi:putative holliday junction resolvase